jgi:hypothetical protein
VEENGPQDAFTETCPAALILQLGDHIHEFVGLVIYPSRSAAPPGADRGWLVLIR